MIQRAVRRALRKRGLDIIRRRDNPDINMFLDNHQIDLVVDVGANEGQFATYIRRWGYKKEIVSFEPTASAYEVLSGLTEFDKNWRAIKTAVGAQIGIVDINVSQYSVFSSIKPLLDAASNYDRRAAVVSVERVPIDTLDNLLRDKESSSVFLKVDTQGFEKEVLNGASQVLRRVKGISLELPISVFYANSWNFIEAINFVDCLGFVPAQFSLVSPMINDGSSAIEFDCIFRKKNELL